MRNVSQKVRIATRRGHPGPPALPTIAPRPWRPFVDSNDEDTVNLDKDVADLADHLYDLSVEDAFHFLPFDIAAIATPAPNDISPLIDPLEFQASPVNPIAKEFSDSPSTNQSQRRRRLLLLKTATFS
jgi:hypothetical protein